MSRRIQILIVLLLIALVPIRAIASVAIGFCVAGHQSAAEHAHDGGDHGPAQHHGDEAPGDVNHSCSYCAAHCTGAVFVAPADAARFPVSATAAPIPFGERLASGFVPEHLDRPPLAL
jgi:hypothetical protein